MQDSSIVIGADDFGLHGGINAACVALARQGRLSAVSCMAGAPAWRGAGAEIAQLTALPVDLGLHLDFIEHPFDPGMRHSLQRLLALAYARRLDGARVSAEIHAQLDAFEAVAGRAPDHVDGHQHIHQFPVIRDALVRTLAQRYRGRKPWIRCTAALDAPGTPRFKPRVIARLGSDALSGLAGPAGFAQNRRLGGVYGFDAGEGAYRRLLAAWLAASSSGDLLMCHPGIGSALADGIAAARRMEYGVLASSWFGECLAQRRLAVGRLMAQGGAVRP